VWPVCKRARYAMDARIGLWTMILVDAILFVPGSYLASGAVGIAGSARASMAALGVAALFLALPVFCIAAPYAAWRTHSSSDDQNALAIAAMPILYAAFLTLFVFWQ
jgi:hypothetical protein